MDYLLSGEGELLLEDQLNQPAIYEIVQEHQGPPYYNVGLCRRFRPLENDQTTQTITSIVAHITTATAGVMFTVIACIPLSLQAT